MLEVLANIGYCLIFIFSEVNVEVTDKYGFTPLMQAAQKGYPE